MKKKFLLAALFFFCVVIARAQNFNIGLNVNSMIYDTVYLDEPLILTISLSNQFASYHISNNRASQNYLDELKTKLDAGEVKQEYYDTELKRVIATMHQPEQVIIGSETQPWNSQVSFDFIHLPSEVLSMQLFPNPLPATDAQAVLDETARYLSSFGMDNKLVAGDYEIKASVQNHSSNKIYLRVLPQSMTETEKQSEPMLLHFAEYHQLKSEFNKAIDYINQAIALYPQSESAFLMRADIFFTQNKLIEALADYETALQLFYEQFPDSYELPEYTLAMIEWVKKGLGK